MKYKLMNVSNKYMRSTIHNSRNYINSHKFSKILYPYLQKDNVEK